MRLPPRPWSADTVALGLAALLAVVVSLPAMGSVPMWDGTVYANCLLDVVYGTNLGAIACADHPTHVYMAALLPGQLLLPGSSGLMHASHLALHVLALWGFARVLAACLPGVEHRRLRALALCAAAIHPAVLGTLFHPNPDTGVYVFAMALMGTTIGAPRESRMTPALLAGLGICFSKETGIAVALVIGAGAMLAAPRWRTWRGAATLALPPILAVAWITWARLTGVQKPWVGTGAGAEFIGFAPFAWGDPTFTAYLFGIFLLGFGWLVTSATAADAIVGASRLVRRLPARMRSGLDGRTAMIVAAIALTVTLGLTTYHTFHHVRYFLLLYPILLIVGVVALVRLDLPRAAREGVVAVWLAANLLGTWTSVDPVSRAFYGTFDAGGMPMYEITSFTGECCGRGQDQLVYNLQYTGFSLAQDEIFPLLQPTVETIIAGPGPVNWWSFSQLDVESYTRTLRRTDAYMPIYTEHFTVMRNPDRIPELWFIDMPNADNRAYRLGLADLYRETESVTRSAHGVSITARKLIRR